MAQETNDGLGLFYLTPPTADNDGTNGAKSNVKSQSEMYFKDAKDVLGVNEYGEGGEYNEYIDKIVERNDNGFGVRTKQSSEFNDKREYIDVIRSEGSQILKVMEKQVGNVDEANFEDYKELDAYFNHGQP